jgi:hypothetical protein
MADKFQAAQSSINGSGDAIAPDQILPALKGTAKRSLSQSAQSNQPLVGVIDSGFGTDEHGSKMVEAIQKENPQAKIWRGGGVGTGGGVEGLVKFVDVAKATGQSRAVANLSFDLTEVHPDGSISTRTQLTAKEQSALAYARDNGVLVVASAGNQGGAMSALGQASQPFDNLIVVGAANGSDRASYSSYGKGLDLVADVGAAGTSLAAAKTTGAIAKLWSDNPELSSQQVNQLLTATATDLKAPGWDAETGAGLLNSGEAIDLAKTITPKTQMFSGNQLMQQLNQSSEDSTWRSTNGSVASERTAGFAALVKPNIDAMREAVNLEPKAPNPPDASDRPNWNLFDGIAANARKSLGIADAEPAAPEPNPPDSAAMEQHNPALGQVAIQQGDTLWDVAQKQLGSGDRWRELRKPDGSPFTEQEASRLQVGTSVQIPGAQPDPIVSAVNTEPPPPMEQPNLTPAPEPTPPAPPPPAPAPDHVTDFFSSVVNKVWEAGEGAVETVTNPGQAVNDFVNSVHTIVTDPGQAWDSFSKPYLDALNEGRYGDFLGQIGGDALLAVSPGGLAVRVNNVLGNLPDAPPAPTPAIPSPNPTPPALTPEIPSSNPIPTNPTPTPAPNPSDLPPPDRAPDSIASIPDDAIPSSSPIPTNLTPTPAPNPSDLPPSPAPDSIASIPDDVGNAVREMGDGETFNNPPSSSPPAPQVSSPDNGGNILPQNPLTDGRSPSPSGSELADPNVSRPPAADNPDRPLVTIGARDLDQASSSPDRSTADSRNYEPVAVGGGNGGTRPSDPPTAVPTPSATTRDQNSRADSPPPPQSGGSGGGNQPPQDPPTGGDGSPSSSDSEPDDPNRPPSTNGTSNTPPQGAYRNSRGRFARNPNSSIPAQPRDREGEFTDMFRVEQARIIASDKSHPLSRLLDEHGKLVEGIDAGHTMMHASGRREMLALEDSSFNRNSYQELQDLREGKPSRKDVIEIDGVTVELESAKKWENEGRIPKGTVENALSRPGWTKDLKINDRGVEVAEATGRFSEAEIQRLKKIADPDDDAAINRLSSTDRKLYRDYYQALMDSRPKVKNGRPEH